MADKGMYANVDGAWKFIEVVYINVGGSWFEAYAGWNDAEGGTVTEYTKDDGTRWRCHTFTSSGTFTVKTAARPFRVFVLGGGGGASGYYAQTSPGAGGGGGAWHDSRALDLGAHAVTIGAGGGGGYTSGYTNGGDTSLGSLVAGGGGVGLRRDRSGASGSPQSVSPNPGQRYGVGTGATPGNPTSTGLTTDIRGSSETFGAGGGGVNVARYGHAPAQPPNTGNGGDWAQWNGTADDTTGGAGGSGIVIVAYQTG